MSARDIGAKEPLWAIELLRAFLVERTGAMDLDAAGKVAVLEIPDHNVGEVVRKAAEAEPLAFAMMAVPYLRAVMAATAREPSDDGHVRDEHFSLRMIGSERYERDFDGALLAATVDSSRSSQLRHRARSGRFWRHWPPTRTSRRSTCCTEH